MADYRFAPSQWDMSLQSNTVSHWLGANLESARLVPARVWYLKQFTSVGDSIGTLKFETTKARPIPLCLTPKHTITPVNPITGFWSAFVYSGSLFYCAVKRHAFNQPFSLNCLRSSYTVCRYRYWSTSAQVKTPSHYLNVDLSCQAIR